jgi:glycosyltransferase involved in cell wall biosynthesis
MPLRIAYISSTFPDFDGCGTGIYAGYLTQALSGLNHDIHVITSAREEIKNTHARVTMHKVMTDWGLSQAPRMIQTLMQIRPQIIHLNHPTVIAGAKSKFLVNLLPEICATMMKVPFVTTLHEFGQVSRLGKIKLQPLLWGSDAITVTNKYYKNLIEKSLPDSMSKKIEIVDVGTNFSDVIIKKANLPSKSELKEKWGFKNEDCVLGFFG